jgi:N-acetylmuramic acid 6-phosphate etherase
MTQNFSLSTTESTSYYDNLEQMSVNELLTAINTEDQTVPSAVAKVIPQIEILVAKIVEKMQQGGKIFYIGAGTSGRLGVVDASECPPTFGVAQGLVVGLIAGGDAAIRKAVEFAEDDNTQAWQDLSIYQPTSLDTLIGIAASGKTPYVLGGLEIAQKHGLTTACIVCNANSVIAKSVEYPIEVIVGAEFLTGSTRMKAGTAQKLVLNMISTAVMIQLGKVKGNKMVDMQLSNHKLIDRGTKMIMQELGVSEEIAKNLLAKYGQVRKAIDSFKSV